MRGDETMVIRYSDGSYIDGVIHRLEGSVLRAEVAGRDDAVEFRLVRDQWISESGNAVTFEFPLRIRAELFEIAPPIDSDGFGHCAVGGDCLLRRMSGTGDSPLN